MLAFVPGMRKRIAEYNPPERAPTYMAQSRAKAKLLSMLYVSGVNSAIAMVAEMPGRAPARSPTVTPISMGKNRVGFRMVVIASI